MLATNHLKTHSRDKTKKCNHCDYAPMHARSLRTHLQTHSGYPPFSVKKKSMKNWLKNGVFWAKIAVFGEKISVFGNGSSVEGGGGVPPFSVNFFSLTFRKNLVRGGPGGTVGQDNHLLAPVLGQEAVELICQNARKTKQNETFSL